MQVKPKLPIIVLLVVAIAVTAMLLQGRSSAPDTADHDPHAAHGEVIAPESARAQAAAFIADYRSIDLTAEQERTKIRALETIPAPCCDDNSMATCCCPCNLAKAVWGLSARLIAEEGADAAEVQNTVVRWLQAVNPDGWSGDACYTGGCDRPFHQDGCGGMHEGAIL